MLSTVCIGSTASPLALRGAVLRSRPKTSASSPAPLRRCAETSHLVGRPRTSSAPRFSRHALTVAAPCRGKPSTSPAFPASTAPFSFEQWFRLCGASSADGFGG